MPSLSFATRKDARIARIAFYDAARPVNVLNGKTIGELEACITQIEE